MKWHFSCRERELKAKRSKVCKIYIIFLREGLCHTTVGTSVLLQSKNLFVSNFGNFLRKSSGIKCKKCRCLSSYVLWKVVPGKVRVTTIIWIFFIKMSFYLFIAILCAKISCVTIPILDRRRKIILKLLFSFQFLMFCYQLK